MRLLFLTNEINEGRNDISRSRCNIRNSDSEAMRHVATQAVKSAY